MVDEQLEQWSYYVFRLDNPTLSLLQAKLEQLGADGWELVTSVSQMKTLFNVTGNDLIFVFKKRGLGHVAGQDAPTVDQESYLRTLLRDRGFEEAEIDAAKRRLARRGLWTAPNVYEVSSEWATLDRVAITAWLESVDPQRSEAPGGP